MPIRVKVVEYPHAYLVRAVTPILWGITIQQARKALVKKLGEDKREAIYRMPCRPLWTGEFEPREKATSAVAFYFNIGELCPPEERCGHQTCRPKNRNKYKP